MIILNSGQKRVVEEAVEWNKSGMDQVFQVGGSAGTGKSFTAKYIIESIGLSEANVLPIAYTGQAAIVMRTRGMMSAMTCHSALMEPVDSYIYDDNGKLVMDKQFNIPMIKTKFVPKKRLDPNIKLILIDEAPMTPSNIADIAKSFGLPIIALGDRYQLPPITGDMGFFKPGSTVHYLTELVRQSESDPIVYLANKAKNGENIECGLYGKNALVMYDDEFNYNLLSGTNITLCYRNSTRENINNWVRSNIIHTDRDVPVYNERVICKKNNWGLSINGISLANGLTGTVKSDIDVSSFNGKTFKMNFLPDLLDIPFIDISVDYEYLNSDSNKKKELKNKKFSIGEKFDYAYASTVHSAQGSEYDYGIYINEYAGDIQRNLDYTAITRFKKGLIYVKKRPKKFWI